MAITVGGVAIDLSANAGEIIREMDKAGRAVSQAARQMEQSGGRFTRFFSRMETQGRRAADRVGRSFSTLGRALSKLALPVGLGAGLGGLLSGAGIKQAIDDLDKLAKQADKVGVTVEALQKFRFSAEQSGVATQTADMALQRFSRRVGEAAQGKGELVGVLEQYNIATRDAGGRTRSLNAILGDYADVVAGAESQQEQLRLAFKAFDSEGAALVNLLRQGRGGMDDLASAAERLGIVQTEQARAAEQASDALGRLAFGIRQRLLIATADAIPAIERLADTFTEALPSIAEFTTKGIEFIERFVQEGKKRFETTRREIEAVVAAFNAAREFFGLDPLGTAIGEGEGFTTARENLAALDEKLQTLRSSAGDFTSEIAAGEAQRQRLIDQIQLAETSAGRFAIKLDDVAAGLSALPSTGASISQAAARPPPDIGGLPTISEIAANAPPPPDILSLPTINQTAAFHEQQEELARTEEAARRFEGTFSGVFSNLIDPTRDFTDTLSNIPNILANLVIQMTLLEPLARGVGRALSGTLFGGGGFLIPGFASGGSLPRNRLALVGERGPELIATGSGGHVFDAGATRQALGGSGERGGVSIGNIDLRGAGIGAGAEVMNVLRNGGAEMIAAAGRQRDKYAGGGR